MKYKIVTEEIVEDSEILENQDIYKLANEVGVTAGFLYKLKRGEQIATEEMYDKIILAVDQHK